MHTSEDTTIDDGIVCASCMYHRQRRPRRLARRNWGRKLGETEMDICVLVNGNGEAEVAVLGGSRELAVDGVDKTLVRVEGRRRVGGVLNRHKAVIHIPCSSRLCLLAAAGAGIGEATNRQVSPGRPANNDLRDPWRMVASGTWRKIALRRGHESFIIWHPHEALPCVAARPGRPHRQFGTCTQPQLRVGRSGA